MARLPNLVCSLVFAPVFLGCTVTHKELDPRYELARARVLPGLTVLLTDSIGLIRGKRVGVLANHTAIDERNRSIVDLLFRDPRARAANVTLQTIFSPEHGFRGAADTENLPDTRDETTGVLIYSLYRRGDVPPPDSMMRGIDVLVVDLQDIGTRTYTYAGTMVYAMQVAARNRKPFIVLDRPNPITGFFVEGPMLDTAIATADTARPGFRARSYALHPIPLRHGLTIGELALYYNDALKIGADLHVVPMRGWSRDLWFDRTELPWVNPSPAMTSLHSALLYPALVPFEATNMSVGRGTDAPFQRIGAPWMRVRAVLDLLAERPLRGVKFQADTFVPVNPTDRKHGGRRVPGIRMVVTNRNQVQSSRIGATLLWAIARTTPDSLKVDAPRFDLLFGDPAMRAALIRGTDPDMLIDREIADVFAFREKSRPFFLYR